MGANWHTASQLAALPFNVSAVQTLPSSQAVGQLAGGSQVSPGSVTEFPQTGAQSPSLVVLQAAGQQPSPLAHTEMGVN